jgi:hypothetical protein
MRSRRWTTLATAVASVGATLALAAPASAGLVVQTTTNCPAEPISQPFSRWLDPFPYQLAPGGSFEAGAPGWRLAGAARVVAGNEPWRVTGGADGASLRLPSGTSATTPPVCVGLEHPTIRFFARRNSGLLSTLAVSAVVTLQGGGTLAVPVGVVVAGGSWTPTLPYFFVGNFLPLLPGQYTPVSFRFTPILGGDWQIDDVYIDPWKRS